MAVELGDVVVKQPVSIKDDPLPTSINSELQKIVSASRNLIVRQRVDLMEALSRTERVNHYEIQSDRGEKLLDVVEMTSWCQRNCCRCCGSFKLAIRQGMLTLAVLDADRDCCGQMMRVLDGGASTVKTSLLGTVNKGCELCGCLHPNFYIKDDSARKMYTLKTPCCLHCCTCCSDVSFPIYSNLENEEVGIIERKADDYVVNRATDKDNYHLIFHRDVPIDHKVLLLAAVFLVDFNYYEN